MKKTILKTIMIPIFLAMLTTPVLAAGPWEAEEVDNNPHLEVVVEKGQQILQDSLKNGLIIRWHDDSSYTGTNVFTGRDVTWYRPASKGDVEGEVKNAVKTLMVWVAPPPYTNVFVVQLATNPSLALEYEDKWIYMSNDYVRGYFTFGYGSATIGDYYATLWPYGVYYKYADLD